MTPGPCQESDLGDALSGLRQAETSISAPPHVEAAVLAAWDRAHISTAHAPARSLWREAAAIAAAVTMAVGLGKLGYELRRTTRTPTAVENNRTLLLVGEPILQGEPVRVVRMRVPAATLRGLGVRPAASDIGEHVDVDVLVGEDGVARAIRLGM